MIEREEIEQQSENMGVHHAHVQRDYVFGWLLKCFYENAYLAPLLVFKGGNCMRKAFYPETRFSADLDFSIQSGIDLERMQGEINRACAVAHASCGVHFEIERNSLRADQQLDRERRSFKGRVYFTDFYGQSDNLTISVRLDLTEFERLHLPVVSRPLIHPYTDATSCQAELRCMALEELLANKLKCLIQRRHSFDLYDLVYATFFERSIEVDRSQVLQTFLRKTIFNSSPGAAKEILLGIPMTFFRGAWAKYVAPMVSRFDFNRAEEGFRQSIEGIFGGVYISGRRAAPFFPSHFRNLILEAGIQRRVLTIQYQDGRDRIVEPYALAYKRRKDGMAAEYLFVWDQTGGTTSGPGLKTFVHENIRRLELADAVFEPRYPIELAKAGEPGSNEHFGGNTSSRFGRTRRTVSRSQSMSPRSVRPNPYALKYVMECPYCLKRFTRTQPGTALRAHNDANGYACTGRSGYQVW